MQKVVRQKITNFFLPSILYSIILSAPLSLRGAHFSPEGEEAKLHALYLMQKNQIEDALAKYREFTTLTGKQDFEALQQMGLILLQHGIKSQDPQVFMMTLFGVFKFEFNGRFMGKFNELFVGDWSGFFVI